jgi:hypothetical protein
MDVLFYGLEGILFLLRIYIYSIIRYIVRIHLNRSLTI